MPDIQDNGSQTMGFDYGHQLTRCTQTGTDDWTVWTPWVYLVRRIMRVRRRQLLFYSNGIQLQRVTRYLLDCVSDVNVSIGPGGPIDHEVTRWSAAGMAQVLDHNPEADFSEARENLRLYQSGAGRYSDVVVTATPYIFIRLVSDVTLPMAPRLSLSQLGQPRNRRPNRLPPRHPPRPPPHHGRSHADRRSIFTIFIPTASPSACGRLFRRFPESFRTT